MCGSIFRPSIPTPLPIVMPAPVAPTEVGQASARPAGFSEAEGRNLNVASSYDRKRIGSSKLMLVQPKISYLRVNYFWCDRFSVSGRDRAIYGPNTCSLRDCFAVTLVRGTIDPN